MRHSTVLSSRRRKGFTLLELICVITVMGILAAVAAMQTGTLTGHHVATEAERLRRQISHVQAMASQWGIALRIDVTANNGYAVRCLTARERSLCPAGVTTPTDPATGEVMARTLANGVTIAGASIAFDNIGRPYSGTALITANATYTLTGAGQRHTVTIAPITGFVQVN